ncbi:MAG: hypothetical protein JWL59_3629 [Chthoniobacteraceae bacterium]|nr:hypothetical protein [Chthoniobacteraceae bacterium]
MKERPWIWLIIANVFIFAAVATLAVVAMRHAPQEIPVSHGP